MIWEFIWCKTADEIYKLIKCVKCVTIQNCSKQFGYAQNKRKRGISMILLVSTLVSDIVLETAKFILMLVLLVVGVFIGGKLRKRSDAKKAAKKAAEEAEAVNSVE